MDVTHTISIPFDPALSARVVRAVPLRYAAGADPALDRPAHVRAGSALAWIAGRLAVVQDDAGFLALVDPETERVDAVTLPAAADGVRQWDDPRGNKALKPDLEACIAVRDGGEEVLLAFGSGSSPRRERVLEVRGIAADRPEARWIGAAPLYAALRARTEFAGSELNVEGAVVVHDVVRLLGRGNGAPRDGLRPIDATCDLPLAALLAFLRSPADKAPPEIGNVVRWAFGEIGGQRLGFTDAASLGSDVVLYVATAEDSPDAVRDGPVAGSALGVLEGPDGPRWTPIRAVDGTLFDGKVEGLAPWPGRPDRLWIVLDRDDPAAPAELCEVALEGPWPGMGGG